MASRARKRKRRSSGYQAPARKGLKPPSEAAQATPTRPSRRAAPGGKQERPPAPWGSFPLVELIILLALIILVAGFFIRGTRGVTMIATGLTLAMLAGLELSIREHFAGYKSHTTVLAGFSAVVVLGICFFVLPSDWPPIIKPIAGGLVFGAAFYLFREAFKRRSGGVGFRS